MPYRTLIILPLFVSGLAAAAEYECKVTRKVDSERAYTTQQLERGQFSIKLTETADAATVSRCSFSSSEREITCDQYKVDRVEFDDKVMIKKYYVFGSQFDFQLFPNLLFVENNGRGGVAYGRCSIVSP
jgi:hypothetical protein